MAYSVSTLSSTVVSNAFDRNKPVFIGENVLRGSSVDAVWRTWTSSLLSLGRWDLPYPNLYEATDTNHPTKYAFDDHAYVQTKATYSNYTPSPGTNDNAGILFEFPAGTVDSLAIVNHNFFRLKNLYSTVSQPLYIEVWIADDKNFSVNKQRVYMWTDPPSNKPLVALNLSRKQFGAPSTGNDFEQYSGLQYMQIKILCFGAAMTVVPEIGEVILGRRTQLAHQAMVPYLDRLTSANVDINDPSTGQVNIYKKAVGMQQFQNNFRLTTDKDDFITFTGTHIDHGTLPFIYGPRPSSNWTRTGVSTGNLSSSFPTFHMMHLTDPSVSLVRSNESPFDFLTSVSMQEIPPFTSGMS